MVTIEPAANLEGLDHPIFGVIQHGVRSWDIAASEKKQADYTASCLMVSTSKGYRIVLDMSLDRVTPGDRDQLIRSTAERDGTGIAVYIEEEGGGSGKDLIYNYTKLLPEFNVIGHRPSVDKITRAQTVSSWVQWGLVVFVRGEWNNQVFAQLKAFPNGDHDDAVDALSSAFNRLGDVDKWVVAGQVLTTGPQGGRILDEKDVSEMDEGPLKNILQHTRSIVRNRR